MNRQLKFVVPTLLAPTLLALTLSLGWVVLAPGLSGPFLLDDFAHLPKLAGQDGTIDTPTELWRLAFSEGTLDSRPLAYLSLLINDNAWPTSPAGFKRFNVLVHLLNGVLVFIFARKLSMMVDGANKPEGRHDAIAVVTMALWLLHPLQLSPTMLVIQRMTLLAGTFTLLALIAYLHGRDMASVRPTRALFWLTMPFGLCMVLGVLNKEPAILTALFVIAMELTVLGPTAPPRPSYWRLWAMVFLGVPVAVIVAYFISIQPYIGELFLKRDFTMGERMLTEARVLMQYVKVIVLPSIAESGPYHDDFPISRGILNPLRTLSAVAVIIFLLSFSVWGRRRYPLVAFAVLWFIFGHVLESTILPIELYFEHRNYMPMIGLAFAVAYGALSIKGRIATSVRLGLAAFVIISSAITFCSARVWGDANLIAHVWAAEHPGSVRAQLNAIRYWAEAGSSQDLLRQLNLAINERPKDASLRLIYLMLDRCRGAEAPALNPKIDEFKLLIPVAPFEHGSLEGLDILIKNRRKGLCKFTDEEVLEITALYLSNPRFFGVSKSRAILHRIRADVYGGQGYLDGTIRELDLAYNALPDFEIPLNQAWLLATAGLFAEAEEYLKRARATPSGLLVERLWRPAETDKIETLVHRIKYDFKSKMKSVGYANAQ
jgi:protein O-mannosyl-transferase